MAAIAEASLRVTGAVHGTRALIADDSFELGLTQYLKERFDRDSILAHYGRFAAGENDFDARMRRAVWRAVTRRFGQMVHIGPNALFRDPETIEIGDAVHVGAQTYIQGCPGGRCVIGNHVWIGPQSYFDARDMVIEDHVGWGPGAKILTSQHRAWPVEVPIIQTDLEVRPVRIEAWADVGTNAIIMPGVTLGRGCIVGAGAVVTRDVPPFAVVAGVPARVLRFREDDPERRGR